MIPSGAVTVPPNEATCSPTEAAAPTSVRTTTATSESGTAGIPRGRGPGATERIATVRNVTSTPAVRVSDVRPNRTTVIGRPGVILSMRVTMQNPTRSSHRRTSTIVVSAGDPHGGSRKSLPARGKRIGSLKVTQLVFDTSCRKMSGFRELPRRARWWISAVVVTGATLVATQLPSVARWNNQEFLAWVGLSAVTALLEQFTVKIAHRSEVENYSLTDAFWVPALIFAPGSVLILGVCAGIIVGQTTRRWKWVKVAN